MRLVEFSFVVQSLHGKENIVAAPVSRVPWPMQGVGSDLAGSCHEPDCESEHDLNAVLRDYDLSCRQ